MESQELQLRSTRPLNAAWVGGVCAGLADHLGWSVLVVRLLFVLLGATALIGVVIYLALWLVMPRDRDQPSAPGLEAATRTGLRSVTDAVLRPVDLGVAAALALLGVGGLWLVQASGWGLPPAALAGGLLASGGLGLIWWRADHVSTRGLRSGSGWRRLIAPLIAHWTSLVMILVGLAAIGAGIWMFVADQSQISELGRTLLLAGLAVAGLALVVLPWMLRVRTALAQARQDALLADARADMAAHLHDSVLQTLALIQRRAADPKAVAALARRQERELRQWLYGESSAATTLAEALAEEIAEVEDRHRVEVELVTVGDAPLTAELGSLVKAAREAMVNAARHSGAPRIDVFAEADAESVAVYVRDRGCGFDLAGMDPDRMGVRGSIIERMKRAGGRAIIRTAPTEGTEIRLELPR